MGSARNGDMTFSFFSFGRFAPLVTSVFALALPMMLPVGCPCLGTWMVLGAEGDVVPTALTGSSWKAVQRKAVCVLLGETLHFAVQPESKSTRKSGMFTLLSLSAAPTLKMRQWRMDGVWTWNPVSRGSICLCLLLVTRSWVSSSLDRNRIKTRNGIKTCDLAAQLCN